MIVTEEVENNQTVSYFSYDLTDLRKHPDYIRCVEIFLFQSSLVLSLQILPELVSTHLHMHSSCLFPDLFQLQDFFGNEVRHFQTKKLSIFLIHAFNDF